MAGRLVAETSRPAGALFISGSQASWIWRACSSSRVSISWRVRSRPTRARIKKMEVERSNPVTAAQTKIAHLTDAPKTRFTMVSASVRGELIRTVQW